MRLTKSSRINSWKMPTRLISWEMSSFWRGKRHRSPEVSKIDRQWLVWWESSIQGRSGTNFTRILRPNLARCFQPRCALILTTRTPLASGISLAIWALSNTIWWRTAVPISTIRLKPTCYLPSNASKMPQVWQPPSSSNDRVALRHVLAQAWITKAPGAWTSDMCSCSNRQNFRKACSSQLRWRRHFCRGTSTCWPIAKISQWNAAQLLWCDKRNQKKKRITDFELTTDLLTI